MTISASDIMAVTKSVTKEWTKQRKAEERGTKSRQSRGYVYSNRVDFTAVAAKILPAAYAHASGDGKFSVSKRQFYYACREEFRKLTKRELEAGYFSNTLLVQYMNRHPTTTKTWKVTADARGNLTIPNAAYDVRVPCGTLQIEDHLCATRREVDWSEFKTKLPVEWPSLAGGQRYQGVLYIEKEGFEPILNEARISERYDLAILSCKGQSVVAARHFVDEVCRSDGGVPLFVVHDFDKSGFEISQRLTQVSDWAEDNDRVAYRFKNDINVTDLGLRLDDALKYKLGHERCAFTGGFASDSIATEEEKEFLRTHRRIELNAFTSPQFIEWLESKLTEAGLKERLIPTDKVLEAAYRRAVAVAHINEVLEGAIDDALREAEAVKIPKDLRKQLQKLLKSDSPKAWDAMLYNIARENL